MPSEPGSTTTWPSTSGSRQAVPCSKSESLRLTRREVPRQHRDGGLVPPTLLPVWLVEYVS